MTKRRGYLLEFLSIFLAVISAFALNNWNDNRKINIAEDKILEEISNGLESDLEDIDINIYGHNLGLNALDQFYKIVNNKAIISDTLHKHYSRLTRDFISLQNISGYTTLKSRGLEILEDDSLRLSIISLYEYDYTMLRKLEENYEENQFFKHHYKPINEILSPHFTFENGQLIDIKQPIQLTSKEKNRILSAFEKIRINRNFMLRIYNDVKINIAKLKEILDQ